VAKAVGTAAWLSGGRVSLGVGAGWMKEEFDALGEPFAGRGARMEEMIAVLRTLWRGGMVEHHGGHYGFPPLEMSPVPPGPVPILIGGHSDRALARAARLGNGWMGVYYDVDTLAEYVARLRGFLADEGRADEPFEVTASVLARPTPSVVAQLEEIGLTTLLTSAWLMEGRKYASFDDNAAALRRFGEQYIEPLRVSEVDR
jgi:alkanesulfonate monooxygenase SsuD/methylene tetrahydromethanopterin reductase-like flavin-dependent oxidoreductase (luciferase family)